VRRSTNLTLSSTRHVCFVTIVSVSCSECHTPRQQQAAAPKSGVRQWQTPSESKITFLVVLLTRVAAGSRGARRRRPTHDRRLAKEQVRVQVVSVTRAAAGRGAKRRCHHVADAERRRRRPGSVSERRVRPALTRAAAGRGARRRCPRRGRRPGSPLRQRRPGHQET